MFTGIIEETGTVKAIRTDGPSCRLTIAARRVLEDLQIGDSIAVSGVCLTVTSRDAAQFTADVMHETLNRSTLGSLSPGSLVNLERAMPAGGRFGGHIVSGHIDAVGTITATRRDGIACWYTIQPPQSMLRYIIEKGSIAIDGISLTVAAVTGRDFSVSVIPHTAAHTTLQARKRGDRVNLEADQIGKYVEKLLTAPARGGMRGARGEDGASGRNGNPADADPASGGPEAPSRQPGEPEGVTMEFLAKYGFA